MDEDTSYLKPLRKNCDFYLKKYDGNANLEEKYKDVFLVSENPMQYEPNHDFEKAYALFNNKKYEEALPYVKKAAEQNYARAFTMMGLYYRNGFVVAKDAAEAIKWYRRSAEKGNALGQYYLSMA
jgi:hypothetical protein